MNSLIPYLHIFLIAPFLAYLGFGIVTKTKHYEYFGYLVLLTMFFIVCIHINDFIKIAKKIYYNEPLDRNFGLFLIIISIFIVLINIYKLMQ
jgi:hypothetical protein